jgi:DNA (cytosine-5)-methyltransferase 1
MRPRLLELFSGAGGSAMGWHRAGFDVVCVDLKPQPRCLFEFHQADAIEYAKGHVHEFDAVAGGPPCKVHSALKHLADPSHTDLVPATREVMIESGLPYVIENVPGAPLLNPTVLCGSMFGLGAGDRQLRRHRLFESNVPLAAPGPCVHTGYAIGAYGGGAHRTTNTRNAYQGTASERRAALGIDWMTRDEMAQAIPPAYTEWLGLQVIESLRSAAPAA